MGKIVSKFLWSSDLMKLVIIRPEQGFKHSELSADIPFTHSRSLEEEQRGS